LLYEGRRYLVSGGVMVLEHGFDQARALEVVAKESGWRSVECYKDYGENDRFTVVHR